MTRSSFIILLLVFLGCSSSSEPSSNTVGGSTPILFEVDPPQAAAGSEVMVRGTGFSVIPPENIVIIADTGAAATSFEALEDALQIRFTVPSDAPVGPTELIVLVEEGVSNSIPFEVLP